MPKSLDILCWTHIGHQGQTNGHAAIMLKGAVESRDQQENSSARTYISWWPDSGGNPFSVRKGSPSSLFSDVRKEMGSRTQEGLHTGRFQPRAGQRSLLNDGAIQLHDGPLDVLRSQTQGLQDQFYDLLTQEADGSSMQKQWAQFPTENISIWVETADNVGLNANAMLAWWRGFRDAHKENLQGGSGYKFVSKLYNCSSIVMRALIAGESPFFVKPPDPWMYYSPHDVVVYAQKLQQAIWLANADYQRVFNAKLEWQAIHRTEMHMHPPASTFEMPTVQEWVAMSNTNVRFSRFARRREQNAAIDRLLGEYHSFPQWDQGGAVMRLLHLRLMFSEVGSYLAAKPKGDRLNAMLTLGQIILKVRELKASQIEYDFFD